MTMRPERILTAPHTVYYRTLATPSTTVTWPAVTATSFTGWTKLADDLIDGEGITISIPREYDEYTPLNTVFPVHAAKTSEMLSISVVVSDFHPSTQALMLGKAVVTASGVQYVRATDIDTAQTEYSVFVKTRSPLDADKTLMIRVPRVYVETGLEATLSKSRATNTVTFKALRHTSDEYYEFANEV